MVGLRPGLRVAPRSPKGNSVKVRSEPGVGERSFESAFGRRGGRRGDANRTGNAASSTGESRRLFLRTGKPWNQVDWRLGWLVRKALPRNLASSGALESALETPVAGTSISLPGRTHVRSRSPRLAASGPRVNVGKGSRQNGSVTSGEGLALRAGKVGLREEAGGTVRAPKRELSVW